MSSTESVLVIAQVFSAIFFVSFSLAWIVPLCVAAYQEEIQNGSNNKSDAPVILDLILIAFDSFPVFWIFNFLRDVPDRQKASQEKWKSDPSLKVMFGLSITFLILSLVVFRVTLSS